MEKKQKIKKPKGRPLEYTKEMGDYICELIATKPIGLTRLCKLHPELPDKETIRRWRYRVESFRVQYAQAKVDQADILAEECLEISDDQSEDVMIDENGKKVFNAEFLGRSRLRVDTRKWLASKLLPKQYGMQALIEQKTEENEQLKEEIAELREKLNKQFKKEF